MMAGSSHAAYLQYLLDADVMIQVHDRHYPDDIFPDFWGSRIFYRAGVATIKEVKAEIKNNPPLKKRVKAIRSIPSNAHAQLKDVADYLAKKYGTAPAAVTAQDKFLNVSADGMLVAVAKATGRTLVTQERLVGSNSSEIKIPNVCQALGVTCMNTVEFLRELRHQFVLK